MADLSEYRLPRKKRAVPHPIPEGIDGVVLMCTRAHTHRHAALYALCGLMGMRVSEALSLRVDNFDLVDMTVTVRGKGDKEREVPISNRAWAFIEHAYNAAELQMSKLIVDLPDRTAREAITAAGKKLDFQRPISSHDLRATAATALYRKTKDIRVVQEFLGHDSIETTQVYVAASFDDMRAGMEF